MSEISQKFKALSELLDADCTSAIFSVIDPGVPGHPRPVTLADRYAVAESLALPKTVPDGIRDYFDAARMLWVYGWLYYPFYTWASLHASICVEMALKQRFREDSVPLPKGRRRFADMLNEAVDRGWVKPARMTRIREWCRDSHTVARMESIRRELGVEDGGQAPTPEEVMKQYLNDVRQSRNFAAHPDRHSFSSPAYGYVGLGDARDIIQQLYPA